MTCPNRRHWGLHVNKAGSVGRLLDGGHRFLGKMHIKHKVSLMILFGPSADWVRPLYTGEGSLLYSKSAPLNVNLQKHPHSNIQNNV